MTQKIAVIPSSGNDPIRVLQEEHVLMIEVIDAMATESRHLLTGMPLRKDFWARTVEFLEHFLDRQARLRTTAQAPRLRYVSDRIAPTLL